jgi:hypothetical protein
MDVGQAGAGDIRNQGQAEQGRRSDGNDDFPFGLYLSHDDDA